MTGKVQKIREEVERMHNLLPVMDGDNISVNYADRICTAFEMYIDSLQEEPVSEDLEKAAEQDVCEVVNNCSATGIPNDHIPSWVQDAMINEFIHGAKWQKEHLRTVGNRTMSRTEKFISDCTRNCSNELCAVEDRFGKKVISYHEWLTPEQALRAVEIAKEELINKACNWMRDNLLNSQKYIDGFKKEMEWLRNKSKKGE